MRGFLSFCGLFCMLFSTHAFTHEDHTMPQKSTLAISGAFDAQGRFWRASVRNGFVLVDTSEDMGKTFSAPVKVNQSEQKIGAEGEARPKIAIGPQGNVYVSWTEALKVPFAGYIWFARSINGGKAFEKPYIVHQDRAEITHRFDALNVAPNGKITIVWVDKRDLVAAKLTGKPYSGAAIYYAISADAGKSFAPEQKLADSGCECCRIALTNKPDGTVVALWRHVFAGSERDHAITEITQNKITPVIQRATFGHWVIDGCPHHGPAIASGGENKDWWGYHMAYFDGNDKRPGLYYSRMDGMAWASSPAKYFGDNKKQAAHPALLSIGDDVWLVWRETYESTNNILGMRSTDGGKTWQDAKIIFSTPGKVDYPLLFTDKGQIYVGINTIMNGFKLIPLKN